MIRYTVILIAGAIWSNTMPANLEKYLPWLSDEQRAELYGSITLAASYPRGDPVRDGVINGAFVSCLMADIKTQSAHRFGLQRTMIR